MKRAHQYLVSQGKSDKDEITFKKQLYDLWFKLYKRLVFKYPAAKEETVSVLMGLLTIIVIYFN